MQIDPQPNLILPALRPDLEFYEGPLENDGAPTWNIHDPQSGKYHKVSWAAALVLRRLSAPRSLAELQNEIHAETTLLLDPKDIILFCKNAEDMDLTITSTIRNAEALAEKWDSAKLHPLMWLLTHYLYLRVPLIKPDEFLTKTIKHVRFLASKGALKIYLVLFAWGLFSLSQRMEEYAGTFTFFFNFQGIIYYGLTIIFLKILHEFTHAYVAKHFGVRVPTMGIAFIVFWPLAFCDVTDGWKLRKRTDRLWISCAGVCAELTVAAISLCLWSITTPGILHSVSFILSSVTIISTLLVNLNPAMRFDGYYILGDIWGIDNLRHRSFTMAKWALRKFFLNFDQPAPEKNFSRRRLTGMLVYSIYAWLYRLALYTGIAVLVYYKFTKMIGLILFLTEIGWFIIRPLALEVKYLWKYRDKLRHNTRATITCSVLTVFLLYLLLPLPRRVAFPAFVVSENSQTIYCPADGFVKEMHAERNMIFNYGDPIITIESERLNSNLKIARIEKEICSEHLINIVAYPEKANMLQEAGEELDKAASHLKALKKEKNSYNIRSKINYLSCLYQWDKNIRIGTPLRKGKILGKAAALEQNMIAAFVKEDYAGSFEAGTQVSFLRKNSPFTIRGTVVSINSLKEDSLEAVSLASVYHGDIPVKMEKDGNLKLLEPCYRVLIKTDEKPNPLKIGQTGTIRSFSNPESYLFSLLRSLYVTVLKESGF